MPGSTFWRRSAPAGRPIGRRWPPRSRRAGGAWRRATTGPTCCRSCWSRPSSRGWAHGRPTILDRYPAAEAALARPLPDDPRLAERFELYLCGVELANGFGELTDPVLQRARLEAEMDEKARRYGTRYPLDEDFLAALAAMPPAAGIALGFDRLVMLATGAPSVEAVMWAPPA